MEAPKTYSSRFVSSDGKKLTKKLQTFSLTIVLF